MKNFLKENWFKMVIAIVVLLIGASFFYSYTLRPLLNKSKLDKCIADIKKESNKMWNEYCKIDNEQIGTDGSCLLSAERGNYIIEHKNKAVDECFKKYPQK